MTPRHLNDAEVKRIALEVFRQEIEHAKFVSEDGIRIIASAVFDNKITATKGDIEAIRDEVKGFCDRLDTMDSKVGQTMNMLLRLHSFGEVKQPGFFEDRSKLDDERWLENAENWKNLNANMQKLGIVREAEKIVTANAIIEAQKRKEIAEHRRNWIRWLGTPAIGVAAASIWRVVQNIARAGHAPHWITWTLSLWK